MLNWGGTKKEELFFMKISMREKTGLVFESVYFFHSSLRVFMSFTILDFFLFCVCMPCPPLCVYKIYMNKFYMCVFTHSACTRGARGGQKASDPLVLELRMIANDRSWEPKWILCKSGKCSSALNHLPSPVFYFLCTKPYSLACQKLWNTLELGSFLACLRILWYVPCLGTRDATEETRRLLQSGSDRGSAEEHARAWGEHGQGISARRWPRIGLKVTFVRLLKKFCTEMS